MKTGLIYDEQFLKHYHKDFPIGEIPDRVATIWELLNKEDLVKKCKSLKPREATIEELQLVHPLDYIKLIKEKRENTGYMYFMEETYKTVTTAIGCLLEVVDKLFEKDEKERIDNAMAVVRPPGHHATKNEYMGYGYFNNVAVAAKYAIKKYDLKRIMILDL
jgi:histone deacetylase 10